MGKSQSRKNVTDRNESHHTAVAKKKEKTRVALIITSAVVCFLTFLARDFIKERTKDIADSLQSAENMYLSESAESTRSTQDLTFRITGQLSEINRIKETDPKHDFSPIIRTDLLICQQVRGDLNGDFDALSRFLDKLPYRADDLKKERENLKSSIDKINQQVSVWITDSSDKRNDWVRASQIKLAIALAGTQEIPVAVLGDAVLTRSREIRERAEKTYQVARWSTLTLIVMGILVALYGALSGTKVLGGE
jgi:hypothetical protein